MLRLDLIMNYGITMKRTNTSFRKYLCTAVSFILLTQLLLSCSGNRFHPVGSRIIEYGNRLPFTPAHADRTIIAADWKTPVSFGIKGKIAGFCDLGLSQLKQETLGSGSVRLETENNDIIEIGNLDNINVSIGDVISSDTIIGTVGSDRGGSIGSHYWIKVYNREGQTLNPEKYYE